MTLYQKEDLLQSKYFYNKISCTNDLGSGEPRNSIIKRITGAFYNFKEKIKIKTDNVKEKIMTKLLKKNFQDILR